MARNSIQAPLQDKQEKEVSCMLGISKLTFKHWLSKTYYREGKERKSILCELALAFQAITLRVCYLISVLWVLKLIPSNVMVKSSMFL